ncbi:Uu.00g031340.m01.CDS01 [Anthostomella pinea]|uniref:Uu.00g031340.m01.CDS01 n=1 Tax=Anthostomella pinea TaxID=933095 RepID=A0AAI8YCZ6_9PEZI|nr:Uu.00g031340.m01.CDS01 [Anthostomella pinea]
MAQGQLTWLALIRAMPLLALLALGAATQSSSAPDENKSSSVQECPIFFKAIQTCIPIAPKSFLPVGMDSATATGGRRTLGVDAFANMLDAMNVMQTEYFAPWLGTWPDAIDWTAAVMGTHISGAARTLSEDLPFLSSDDGRTIDWSRASNLVDNYLGQLIGYYFGQDAFAIRNEAYDDILWVVLGWLETVQFVNTHSDLHYKLKDEDLTQAGSPDAESFGIGVVNVLSNETYHGNLWIPAFSHRARIFWDLSTHGWDTRLCGGGMVWNPHLEPYKNAITNELFIAASISMYLYFPGDDNQSPFYNRSDTVNPDDPDLHIYSGPRGARYLKAAVEGYRWLVSSNMMNDHGLYTDGFHISGYADTGGNNTRCDRRNDEVYSYNQGVILTGQRGLWDATGASSFLRDGHKLIQSTIKATGYDLVSNTAVDDISSLKEGELPPWRGLGRLGVMEDTCDASGSCSRDGQTFKGIFFHHLTAFCAPLVAPQPSSGMYADTRAFAAIEKSHHDACISYSSWLGHNAHAAIGTRDKHGKFGQWWTAGLLISRWTGPWPTKTDDGVPCETNGTDYRNYGVPNDTTWRGPSSDHDHAKPPQDPFIPPPHEQPRTDQMPLREPTKQQDPVGAEKQVNRQLNTDDPNKRGRGRTVETQGGGLALMRAHWKLAHGKIAHGP